MGWRLMYLCCLLVRCSVSCYSYSLKRHCSSNVACAAWNWPAEDPGPSVRRSDSWARCPFLPDPDRNTVHLGYFQQHVDCNASRPTRRPRPGPPRTAFPPGQGPNPPWRRVWLGLRPAPPGAVRVRGIARLTFVLVRKASMCRARAEVGQPAVQGP